MKKVLALALTVIFLGVLSYSYASEFRSLYNKVFSIESERIVVSPGDAVVFSFSKQISTIDFNLTSGFTIKTLEGGIWSDIGNTVDQFPPLRGYLVRNFSLNDLVITATYAPVTTIGASIFQKSLKAGWNLVGVAYKDDINGNVSVANGLGAALPYSQVLDFTGNGFSSGSFSTGTYSTGSLNGKLFILKNINNIVSNSGYTINSQASMSGVNFNEGLAYGIFVNNDTLISGSQKLTSAENVPYYTPPVVGVVPDIYVYSGVLIDMYFNANYVFNTDGDIILSSNLTGNLPAGLSFSGTNGLINGITTQTGTYILGFSATDKDGVSNVSNFNLIVSDTASLLNGQNLDTTFYTTALTPPVGSLTAANKLAANGIINDNSAVPANYKLSNFILKEEVAKISANVAGLTPNATCNNIFTDVSATTPNTWACGYTEALVNAGLYSTGSLKFYPESSISKAETLRLALESAGYTGTYTNPSNWQAEVIAFGVAKGITTSFTDYNSPITKGGAYSMFSDARDSMNGGTDLLGALLGNLGGTGSTSTGTTSTGITSICSVVSGGVTYSLSPCSINTSMISGSGDKSFTFDLIPSSLTGIYSFVAPYGYGIGFPTYGILGGVSGASRGIYNLSMRFTDSVLNVGNYNGYLKIGVSSYSGSVVLPEKELRFAINLDVLTGSTSTGTTTGSGIPQLASSITIPTYLSGATVNLDLSTTIITTNGNPISSYGLTGILPTGLSFNTGSALISGVVTGSGIYDLGLTATNNAGTSNVLGFTIIVNTPISTGPSPVVGIIPNIQEVFNGSFNVSGIPIPLAAYSLASNVTSANGNPILNYSLIGTLPTGLTFNNITGLLDGTSTQTGTYNLGLTATNGAGTSNTGSFTIVVNGPVVTTPPVVGTIASQTFGSGATVNIDLTQYITNSKSTPILSYGLTGILPIGVTSKQGGLIISGVSTQTGTYTMGFTATNSVGTSNIVNFNLIINATTPPIIGTIPAQTYLSGATVNLDLSKNATATNGNSILSYGLTGTLPTGLSFNTGLAILSGVVTGSGVYNMKFSATDIDGTSNAKPLTITVNIPVVVPVAIAPLIGTIASQTYLSGSTVNLALSVNVTPKTNPIATYNLTGTLPTGLSFSGATGILSGIVTGSGTYNLKFSATDTSQLISNMGYPTLIIQ